MCTIAVAHFAHPNYPFVAAANRDEFYARPSRAASFWKNEEDILGGRDLRAGGTWLGITRSGRFASLTNLYDPERERADAPSRGEIATGFLRSSTPPEAYVEALAEQADRYNGFNLIVRDQKTLAYYSNRGRGPEVLPPGVYALSNALLGAQWPKVLKAREGLEAIVESGRVSVDDLLDLLSDDEPAPDDLLPGGGIEFEWERALSAIYIRTPEYGTCSMTAIVIDASGRASFVERRAPDAAPADESAEHRLAFNVVD